MLLDAFGMLGDALGKLWGCFGDALGILRVCPGDALGMLWGCMMHLGAFGMQSYSFVALLDCFQCCLY